MKKNDKRRISLRKYKEQEIIQDKMDTYYDFFIKELTEHPPLTQEETNYYFKMYKTGRQDAKDKLILHNLRLVLRVANIFWFKSKKEVPYMDVVQEGIKGLIRGIEKFDMERGFKLSTYSTWWIRSYIQSYYFLASNKLKIPLWTAERSQEISNTSKRFLQEHGREPTNKELSEITGYKEKAIADLKYYANPYVFSLDDFFLNSEIEMIYVIQDKTLENPLEDVTENKRDELLNLFLDERLDEREKQIVSLRYGLNGQEPLKLKEIAEKYSVSKERIRQIENSAIKKLRKANKKHKSLVDFIE